MDNPMHYSEDTTMRQDDRVTSVTFTLPAGHKWTSVEAAMKEAHDREYELRMAFFWECQRLQAEVERLRQEVENADRESMSDEYDLNNQTCIINELLTHKEQMQGKIDRLTKAGDLLAFHYISLGRKFFPDDPLPSSITNWNAAKEGKPSV